jgi:hypothetical protein
MTLRVECYSGWKTDERPVHFEINGHRHVVEEVLDQWHRTDATFFKVRSDDGNYVLRRAMSPQDNSWSLELFRQSSESQ